MRLKSSIFVSALIRREQGEGAFALILRKGAEEAGAIFVVHTTRQGTNLYAPAPQMFFDEQDEDERRFELRLAAVDEVQLGQYLDQQIEFDRDCWIVEIEKDDPLKSILIVRDDTA